MLVKESDMILKIILEKSIVNLRVKSVMKNSSMKGIVNFLNKFFIF